MKKAIRAVSVAAGTLMMAAIMAVASLQARLPGRFSVHEGKELMVDNLFPLTAVAEDEGIREAAKNLAAGKSYEATIKLMGVIPVKKVQVNVVSPVHLVPCGTPFGIKMYTQGVMVVGMSDFETKEGTQNPAKKAGIRVGDVIISIDGARVNSNEEIANIVENSGGKALDFYVARNGINFTCTVRPAVSVAENKYKVGLWVRDSSAGIGTLTFYNEENGTFGGLGHGICDVDTGKIIPLMSGEIVGVSITGVAKGRKGAPGELRGSFKGEEPLGVVATNEETGVFGTLNRKPVEAKAVQMALKQQIKEDKAQIITTLDNNEREYFDIVIERVNFNDNSPTKNMIIRVTDPVLLEKTGGIVQGMSGSPIIQNGMLVGAVTHVFINDPTRGYGIFAENMLETAKKVSYRVEPAV